MANNKKNNNINRQLTKNDFLRTQFHPNWDAIYKELNTNGIDNLHNLPTWITQQMNDLAYNPTAFVINDGSEYATWAINNGIQTKPSIFDTVNTTVEKEVSQTVKNIQQDEIKTQQDEIKTREKRMAEFENKVEKINNRPKISLEENAKQLIESKELDDLHIEMEQWKFDNNKPKIDMSTDAQVKRSEILDERNANIEKLNSKGIEEWKKRQEHKVKQEQYNDWIGSQDYIDQANALNRRLREEEITKKELEQRNKNYERLFEEVEQKEIGNKKWAEAENAKANAEAKKHFENSEKQRQVNAKVNDTWNERSLEAEYQNMKARIDYEYNKPYHGPVTKEFVELEEQFKYVAEERNYMNNVRNYEERAKKWASENPEQAAKLQAKREQRRLHGSNLSSIDDAAAKTVKKEVAEEASKNLKKSTIKNFGHVINAGIAISDYKDAREAGHSVTKSAVKAGAEFVKGELLGGWYMAAMLAKSAPTMAVSAIEGINTMSRSMNSMSRRQVFGDASFQDTQQLATMRQSGMELAKMSQYNLQQTLMGNEAEYLHKL